MIRVSNGYVLTESPTRTRTFPDTVTAVSRPFFAPKCSLLTNAQGGYIPAWETQNNVYPIVRFVDRVIRDNCEAAILHGAGPITVDALHLVSGSGGYYYADFVCKFKWYALWSGGNNPYWDWYKKYSYDDGATWSEPEQVGEHIYDRDQDPTVLKSYLAGSMNYSPQIYFLRYNGNSYHVLPYFGLAMNNDQNTSSAYTAAESNAFAAIIQSEPLAHSDYIHTVSGVVI